MSITALPHIDTVAAPVGVRHSVISRRLGVVALGLAGVSFVVYPLLRPFSAEKGFAGATAFASNRWIEAHTFGIAAFILLGLGFLSLHAHLAGTAGETRSRRALIIAWLSTGITVAFYGAEAFALHALGAEAIRRHDPTLTSLADKIRFGPGIVFIVTGLVGLAVAGVLFARAVSISGRLPRRAGVPLAIALVLYLPQFAASQPVRVAHGLVMAVGCGILAVALNNSTVHTTN